MPTLNLAHGANAHTHRADMVRLSNDGQDWTNANRTMYGRSGSATGTGQLPDEFAAEARDAVYVIYSYHTPIAWRTAAGSWVQPLTSYSPTTSRHQSFAARLTR